MLFLVYVISFLALSYFYFLFFILFFISLTDFRNDIFVLSLSFKSLSFFE